MSRKKGGIMVLTALLKGVLAILVFLGVSGLEAAEPTGVEETPAAITAARQLLMQGKVDQAIDLYDRGRRLDPEESTLKWSPPERLVLAAGLQEQGRYDEAILQ